MKDTTIQQKIFLYTHPGIYKRAIEQLEDAESKVVWILNKYPHTRDCDTCLIHKFWKINDKYVGGDDEVILHSLTTPETIRRVRQKIQNEYGLYIPLDETVIESRKIKKEAVRFWAISAKRLFKTNCGWDME